MHGASGLLRHPGLVDGLHRGRLRLVPDVERLPTALSASPVRADRARGSRALPPHPGVQLICETVV